MSYPSLQTTKIPGAQPEASHIKELPSFVATLKNLRGILVAVACLGLAANFLVFFFFHDFYTRDSDYYVVTARHLAQGLGFMDPSGHPDMFRTPGYPLLIAVFLQMAQGIKRLIVFQHILQILIALATSAFAYVVSKSRRQALIAGVLLCLDLPSLAMANNVMTEILFTACFTAGIWLLWTGAQPAKNTWWRLFLAGQLFGWSTLVRPITVYFFVPITLYLLLGIKRIQVRPALLFLTAFSCLPLAWMVRNYVEIGYFSVSSIPAWNMIGYRAAGVLALDDPGDFYTNLGIRQTQLLRQLGENEDGSPATPSMPPKSVAEKSRAYLALGGSVIRSHPFGYLRLAIRGASLMMLGGDANLIQRLVGWNERWVKALILSYTVPLACMAVVGLRRFWKTRRTFFYLAALVICYFLAVSTGAEAFSRMRVPIMPIYALLIANGADYIVTRFFRSPETAAALLEAQ
jgi:4-amino-4-deoxy-L-arabinose transferase-like glycosyltransferase